MEEPALSFDYAKEFGSLYHQSRRLPPKGEAYISQLRAEKLQQWISARDRVLEYGVGFGWNLATLACAEKIGFDLTPELRSEVEAKGIHYVSTETNLPEGRFDIVLAHHVLEHVRNPTACLRRLEDFLRPSGRLLLFVPFERERKYRTFRKTDRAHHVCSWTKPSLCRLVGAAGWEIIQAQIIRFRFDRIAASLTLRLRGSYTLYRLIRAIAVRILPEYEIAVVARPVGDKTLRIWTKQ